MERKRLGGERRNATAVLKYELLLSISLTLVFGIRSPGWVADFVKCLGRISIWNVESYRYFRVFPRSVSMMESTRVVHDSSDRCSENVKSTPPALQGCADF
jgi:hypothetical protein